MLNDDQRHRLDSMFYDKVVSKYYTRVGQQPPSKVNWLAADQQVKIGMARDFLTNPLVGMIAYDDVANQFDSSHMTTLERAKYYSAKILEGTFKYLNAGSHPDTEKYWSDTTQSKDVLKSGQEKVESYLHAVEPQVQHDLRTKIFGAAAGFIPDLTFFKALGAGLDPILSSIKGPLNLANIFEKSGGISKILKSTPIGNSVYNMLEGSLQGFFLNQAQGEDLHKSLEEARGWGLFQAGLPLVAKVGASPFKASMKLYSEMAAHTGAEFVINSIANTAERIDKGVTEPIKDELIAKLDKANSETLNNIAKQKFNKIYWFLTPGQKQEVTAQVRGILNESFNNPAAHAETATILETNKAVQEQAAKDPVFAKQAARMQAATEKVTGSKVVTGPAKEAKKQVEAVNNYAGKSYGTSYIADKPKFQISRGPDKGNVSVIFPDKEHADLYAYLGRMQKNMSGGIPKGPTRQQLSERLGLKDLYEHSKKYREQINAAIKDLEEGSKFEAPSYSGIPENKNRIVPGAASKGSPEFLSNLLAQYETSVGFENPKHKLLAMWANKDSYPPAIAKRIQEEVDEMYKGLSLKQLNARKAFLEKHIAKLEATWEINPQGDKKRVFRSTGLTPQSKTVWQKELDDLYDKTFKEGK